MHMMSEFATYNSLSDVWKFIYSFYLSFRKKCLHLPLMPPFCEMVGIILTIWGILLHSLFEIFSGSVESLLLMIALSNYSSVINKILLSRSLSRAMCY